MPRIAKALDTLRSQVNALAPKRSKTDDGWLGDTAHLKRKSDHNGNAKGVVQALDLTHDPKGGFNSYAFAELLRTRKDSRIKYVISNGRIFSGPVGPKAWQWRAYSGSNKHDRHVHISVEDVASMYDDPKKWNLAMAAVKPPPDVEPVEDEPKKSGITESAVAGGGLGVAAIGNQVWDNVKDAPESILTAAMGLLSKPGFYIAVIAIGIFAFIWWQRQKQKAAE